jgi:hypothetical protein
MKIFLLTLFLAPFLNFASGKANFIVENKNGYWCITHIANKQEPLSALSSLYFVSTQVLADMNNLSTESTVYINQPVVIPLIETNYFKTGGMSSNQKGYSPLYYIVTNEDTPLSICKKFSLAETSFLKWNPELNGTDGKENDRVVIGWLKYGTQNTELAENLTQTYHNNMSKSSFVARTFSEKKPIVSPTKSIKKIAKSESKIESKPVAQYKSKVPVKTINKNEAKPVAKLEAKKINTYPTKPTANINQRPLQKKTVTSTTPAAKPSRITYANEEKHFGRQVTVFFKRIKNKFNPKEKSNTPSSSHGMAKKETKIKKEEIKNTDYSSFHEKTVVSGVEKKPKSFKTLWHQLVNGKEHTATSKDIKPVNPLEKRTTMATPKNNVLYEKQQALKAKNAVAQSKTTTTPMAPKVHSITPNVKLNEKKKTVELPKIKDPVVNVIHDTTILIKSAPVSTIPEEPIDPTVRHEIKKLSLSRSKIGKCSFFFSGPGKGQFYVFTNLALKGEIIKITNSQNGRYVMAEVIGNLPNADFNKGILIKLSDNAKLPLGQPQATFNAKVNY